MKEQNGDLCFFCEHKLNTWCGIINVRVYFGKDSEVEPPYFIVPLLPENWRNLRLVVPEDCTFEELDIIEMRAVREYLDYVRGINS